ncbi:MAG TPA: carboxylesterase/lipase family protein [Kofleriaceae bacterium]|nr:carboxylesterase/lipase family protein [Kofleriaceae bacterium]
MAALLAACSGDDGGGDVDGGDGDGGGEDASTACQLKVQPTVPAERVATTSGVVRGAQDGETWAYKRVPYAAPPIGDLRLRAPQPPVCPTEEIDATAFGLACSQLDETSTYRGDENCLFLNIWAPAASAAPRPVMFWIHGGGNAVGTASDPIYDGRRLAERGDVVVVTINYRLGQLGFLADASLAENGAVGNYGTLDQIAALRWVRDNIEAFGGDPRNVTVFGESAGGRNTCTLLAAPGAEGLFHRALVQSGACKFIDTAAEAQTTADAVATALACTGDRAACFRAATAEQLTRANAQPVGALAAGTYGSVIDGVTLVEQPEAAIAAGRHHHMPFAIGANADETAREAPASLNETAYQNLVRAQYGAIGNAVLAQYPSANYASPRAAYVRLTTDSRFVCPSREIAAHADAGQTEPVYRYFFRYAPNALGAPHGLDVPFVFGTFDAILVNGAPYEPSGNELALSAAMQGYWSSFARTGAPGGTPAWPAYDPSDTALVLDAPATTEAAIRDTDCDFWRPYYDAL